MFFLSATARTASAAAVTSGARLGVRTVQSIGAGHGTPSHLTAYPEARWRPVRTLTAFRRDVSTAVDHHIPMPVATVGPPPVQPTAGLVDVTAPTPGVVLAQLVFPTSALVDVSAPAGQIIAFRLRVLDPGIIEVKAPTPLVVLRTNITPAAGLVAVHAPTPVVRLATFITPSAGLIDVTAVTPAIVLHPIIILSPGLVAVGAPTLSIDLGTRTLLPTAASFAVVAPALRVLTAPRGHTLAALELPGGDLATTIRLPNLVTQTSYEATLVGAEGFPSVTLPAVSADIIKRRYETTRPIFGYSPSGKVPAPHDTGVYLSADLGVTWSYLALPDFPLFTDFFHPVLAERGGHGVLFFTEIRGQVARYDLHDRTTRLAVFTGPPADVALGHTPRAIAVAPGASQVVLLAAGEFAGVWRSADNGGTFTLANAGQSLGLGLGGRAVACHPVVAGLCYAGGMATATRGATLYRSTDDGLTWTVACSLLLASGDILKIALGTDPDIVYLRTTSALLKSLDQGATVAPIHTGLPAGFLDVSLDQGATTALAVSPSDEAILYCAVGLPGTTPAIPQVYRSADAGATWTLQLALYPSLEGSALTGGIAVHPTDPDRAAFATFSPFPFSGIHLTSTGGTSWTHPNVAPGSFEGGQLFGVAYGTVGATVWLAATGRHRAVTGPRPKQVKIGTDTLYGEQHEVTVTLPFAPAFMAALADRTQLPALPLLPILPLLQVDMVYHYRTGAREKVRLAEVRLERLDVREGAGDRQLVLFGRTTHADIARGGQAARVIPRSEIESLDDTTAELAVTLPGIHTEWQTYERMLVNGRLGTLSAIRYSITTERRMTILSTAATSTAALDPTAASAAEHAQLIVGRTPTSTRRGTPARKTLIWRRG